MFRDRHLFLFYDTIMMLCKNIYPKGHNSNEQQGLIYENVYQ